jgi:hypothetical protein
LGRHRILVIYMVIKDYSYCKMLYNINCNCTEEGMAEVAKSINAAWVLRMSNHPKQVINRVIKDYSYCSIRYIAYTINCSCTVEGTAETAKRMNAARVLRMANHPKQVMGTCIKCYLYCVI